MLMYVIYERQDYFRILLQIPLYLHSLSHLELSQTLLTELIFIFKSCIKLVYLIVKLDDEDLKGLGRFVPKTVKRIWFKLFISEYVNINIKESLRCFLEEYVENNRGALKYLEVGLHCDSRKNNPVTEQFSGVKTVYYNGIIEFSIFFHNR